MDIKSAKQILLRLRLRLRLRLLLLLLFVSLILILTLLLKSRARIGNTSTIARSSTSKSTSRRSRRSRRRTTSGSKRRRATNGSKRRRATNGKRIGRIRRSFNLQSFSCSIEHLKLVTHKIQVRFFIYQDCCSGLNRNLLELLIVLILEVGLSVGAVGSRHVGMSTSSSRVKVKLSFTSTGGI